MTKKNLWLGMLVMTLAFGMMVAGCDGGGNGGDDPPPYVPREQTPLTGTVAVTSNITVSSGAEKMTLTADISDLNGDYSTSYYYQWIREGTNITNARSKTYDVTESDYGKALSVKVTYFGFSGEQSGSLTVPAPTIMSLTLKWDNSAEKKDTGIRVERQDGSTFATTSGNLTTSGTTLTLTSWNETTFKMRTVYENYLTSTKFYFKKDNALGSELFDLTNGAKTFTLTNVDGGVWSFDRSFCNRTIMGIFLDT